MKRIIKEIIIRAVRSSGYDLVKIHKVPYSIFVEDCAKIADVSHQGHTLRFFIGNPHDFIQETLLEGSIYEPEELALIEKHYVPGTTFVDIGSNIGNHALWAAKCLCAPRVLAFEPALGQHTLLCANVALNELGGSIEIRKIALSSTTGRARIARSFFVTKNSGAASVSSTGLGEDVTMSTGDLELSQIGPLFIKIDVEGHEISVLEGLSETIKKHRPNLFVEVDNKNETKFTDWLNENGYEKRDKFKRHTLNCNYIAGPSD